MTQAGWYQPKTGTSGTGPLPLHPMSLGDVLDGAFRLYRANFKTLLMIVAVIDGPVQLVSAVLQRNEFGGTGIFSYFSAGISQQSSDSTLSTAAATGIFIMSAVSYLIALPFTGAAVSRVVAASYLGGVETPGSALTAMIRKGFYLFVAELCVHVVEWTTGLFLVLPGWIFMAFFISVGPAMMVENLGPFASLGRSWSLTRGRLWRVLGTALLSGIIVGIIGSVVADPFKIAGAAIGLRWGWILVFIGSLLGAVVTLALNAIFATLLYFDGRIRHEGFDLQILARTVGV